MRAQRQPVTDEVTRGDETVVMVHQRVLLLSPMASAVLRHLERPRDVEALAEALLEDFGMPPHGDPIVATWELLDSLEAVGLVRFQA